MSNQTIFFKILGSDITRNIIMVFSACVAFIVYILNRRDDSRNAANIVLIEIKEIETVINDVRIGQMLNINIPIMKSNSWNEYKHFFVRNLDSYEYQQINMFYSLAETIERQRVIIANAAITAMEEKEKQLQKVLIDLAAKYPSEKEKYDKEKDQILKIAHNETYLFEPSAPKENLNRAIIGMPNIINTSIGQKLKRYSGQKKNSLI